MDFPGKEKPYGKDAHAAQREKAVLQPRGGEEQSDFF